MSETEEPTPESGDPLLVEDERLRARRESVAKANTRRRRTRLLVAAGVLTAILLGFLATFSPLLDVDRIVVIGAEHTASSTVISASGLHPGQALAYLDAGSVRRRIETLPWVGHAVVRRSWSGVVRIEITERRPAAALHAPDGTWRLVDVSGRILATVNEQPAGLVVVAGASAAGGPGSEIDEQAGFALKAADALPPSLAPRIKAVVTLGDGTLDLQLDHGIVHLGTPEQLGAKYLAVVAILAQLKPTDVRILDVRVPGSPVLTKAGA